MVFRQHRETEMEYEVNFTPLESLHGPPLRKTLAIWRTHPSIRANGCYCVTLSKKPMWYKKSMLCMELHCAASQKN